MKTKQTTVKIQDKQEMVGFIRSIGTECCFVSMLTETEVKMRKTGNPFVGAVKVSQRNGLLNVNYVESVKRKLAEQTGTPLKDVDYAAGSTWYKHTETEEGKPLPLCVHQKDESRFYLQYFPHRTIGDNKYFLNGRELTPAEVTEMKKFIPPDNRVEYKPLVITLAIDSIRSLRARRIKMLNHTVSKIASRLSAFANVPVTTGETKPTHA